MLETLKENEDHRTAPQRQSEMMFTIETIMRNCTMTFIILQSHVIRVYGVIKVYVFSALIPRALAG